MRRNGEDIIRLRLCLCSILATIAGLIILLLGRNSDFGYAGFLLIFYVAFQTILVFGDQDEWVTRRIIAYKNPLYDKKKKKRL